MIYGEYSNLKVMRKSDLGYMLTDGTDEVLMFFKEATSELKDNEEVKVFIYFDKSGRTCATMKEPFVTISTPGFVKINNILKGLGVFFDNNTTKDVLISKDFLPYNEDLWPQIGDTLYCHLKMKNNSFVGKPLSKYDLPDISTVQYETGEVKEGFVNRITQKGYGIVSVDKMPVYVPFTLTREQLHIGSKVEFTITGSGTDTYFATMIEQKEKMIDGDSQIILDYLEAHEGFMPLNAKSQSEEIEKVFKMSRKAFKRALGFLYKEEKVTIDLEKGTYIKKN